MSTRGLTVLGLALVGTIVRAAVGCGATETLPPFEVPLVDDDGDDDEDETDPADAGPSDPPPPPPDGGPPADIPSKIRYVVVLIKENHTFDNYFTGFPGAASSKTAKLSNGTTITRPKAPDVPPDEELCHSHNCAVTAYHDGSMSGFNLLKYGETRFHRYTEAQLPSYWAYAREFVLADHLFQNMMGPSLTGHMVFWAGRPLTVNNAKCAVDGGCAGGQGCLGGPDLRASAYRPDSCTTKEGPACFDVPSIVDHLPQGFTWTNYGRFHSLLIKSIADDPEQVKRTRAQSHLLADLAEGRLSNLTIVHAKGGVSEHPPQEPCVGENFTVEVVNALVKLPQWKEMAVVITWDDWGGYYDHMAPLTAQCDNGGVFEQGFRVPLILLSPYAKKGFVLKTPAEQASVPRMIEDLWGMDYMTARDPKARDGVAYNLMDAFDFDQPPREGPTRAKRVCKTDP